MLSRILTVANRPLLQQCQRNFTTRTLKRLMPIKLVDVPSMGDSITEGAIVDLPVAPGDYVDADDVVVVVETDKVSVDIRAPEAGAIVEIMGEIDDVVEVGSGLFSLDTDALPIVKKDEKYSEVENLSTILPSTELPVIPTSDTSTMELNTPLKVASSPPPPPPTAAVSTGGRTERRTKMSRMRQRVATRLKEAQNTGACLTTFQECDMGNLMELRNKYKEEFMKTHGVKLGFMSCFVKAATAALKEIPALNAYIDDETKEIVYREFCDISVAVGSATGLVVPVLRNTERMSFADVESNIALYSQKAKEGTLALDDMAGGTFTISNGGVYGSLMGTPIINPPQSAILGMHGTKLRPIVIADTGEIVARPMMYLALTYDHRLIDGREAVTFLKSISEKINDPGRLLLDI
mmetsp:Transcript_19484/g.22292  ORF Transcript_19484/g.22292 Transcript_19484/m.22292 type:complete len:408 (+) Transcript_19484:105-1328(+)|eukprot:CAMPEP_0194146072 /NCGR_PEP_ID=MMETSP0152-20130528/19502_1 /TAXON_ID=1049557 /ORGANISM="Thalassiothrix antarctica, Strain L6-D1" /LENGTH=407 /DNA_ID=CAMNT_0038846487 /DNA_START=90 /DNA_END=1313 /DNA_ORIENTATION=+